VYSKAINKLLLNTAGTGSS